MPIGEHKGQLNRRTFLLGAFLSFAIVSGLPLFSGTADGFARARDGSAQAFVDNLNEQRREIYVKRAKSQNVSVDQVGRVYAAQILSKAPKGTWILGENGKWTQK